ncbi:MAG: hypothetical protein ACRCZF_24075, partial [Gemmataceae bacterium]
MKRWIRSLIAGRSGKVPIRGRLLMIPLEDRLTPATIVVTTPTDSGPGSLREAVTQANNSPGDDTITFAPGLGEVVLTSGQLELTDTTGATTITGTATTPQVIRRNELFRTPQFRIFNIQDGVTVDMSQLTITGGYLSEGKGGGINNAGNLTLTNTNISRNYGVVGGIYNSGTVE